MIETKNGAELTAPHTIANQITTGKERLTNLSQIEYTKSIFNKKTNKNEKAKQQQKSTRFF